MSSRCESSWGGVRCELVAGHDSAHGARDGDALVSWVNHTVPNGRRAPSDWVKTSTR